MKKIVFFIFSLLAIVFISFNVYAYNEAKIAQKDSEAYILRIDTLNGQQQAILSVLDSEEFNKLEQTDKQLELQQTIIPKFELLVEQTKITKATNVDLKVIHEAYTRIYDKQLKTLWLYEASLRDNNPTFSLEVNERIESTKQDILHFKKQLAQYAEKNRLRISEK